MGKKEEKKGQIYIFFHNSADKRRPHEKEEKHCKPIKVGLAGRTRRWGERRKRREGVGVVRRKRIRNKSCAGEGSGSRKRKNME